MTKKTKSAATAGSIAEYDAAQAAAEATTCRRLRAEIRSCIRGATSKVWHGAPVWFVGETPVVGYSVPAKGGVVLLFWNGQAFGEAALTPVGKFKAAQVRFGGVSEIEIAPLRRWLKKAATEIWDVRSILRKRSRALARR
jgi:hypothetical protein